MYDKQVTQDLCRVESLGGSSIQNLDELASTTNVRAEALGTYIEHTASDTFLSAFAKFFIGPGWTTEYAPVSDDGFYPNLYLVIALAGFWEMGLLDQEIFIYGFHTLQFCTLLQAGTGVVV